MPNNNPGKKSESLKDLLKKARSSHEENGFEAALGDYYKAFKKDPNLMWSKSKKKIVQAFFEECEGKKPVYKSLLLEGRSIAKKSPFFFFPLLLLGYTLLVVLPALLVKLYYLEEDFKQFFLADLTATLAFVIVGTYLILAMRYVEGLFVRLVCFEQYDRFSPQKAKEYVKYARENLYSKNIFAFSFIFPIIVAILVLPIPHAIGSVLEDIGLRNSFHHYVGEYPDNDTVNSKGFLITDISFATKLWFELGWAIAVVCMIGMAVYAFQMFRVIRAMRRYEPEVNFFHPDGAAGFKPVSNFFFWVEGLGVGLIILIQILFLSLSVMELYSYSSIALLPSLDFWAILAISTLFALVPIGAAIFVFFYIQRGFKPFMSQQKKEKEREYFEILEKYRNDIKDPSKSPSYTKKEIDFIEESYEQVKKAREGPFDYSTQVKAILALLPSIFMSQIISIILRELI